MYFSCGQPHSALRGPLCGSASLIAQGTRSAERRMPTQGGDGFSRLFHHPEDSQGMHMVPFPCECCRSFTLELFLPPELSCGKTLFVMGGWWWCVFWTLLGAACIPHLPEVMGLAPEIPKILGFSRCCVAVWHSSSAPLPLMAYPGCSRELLWDRVCVHMLFLFI